MKRILMKLKRKGWLALILVVAVVATTVVFDPLELRVNASGYNPQAACEYAEAWSGSKRNPDYESYPKADCANYVSQCLRAGGLELGDDWKPYISAWIYVPSFVQALQNRGYQVIENPTADQILPGNPVVYQWSWSSVPWSHAMICVGYDSNGVPIINGHTNDRTHVAWNYGQGSAKRMCTILINTGSASEPETPAPEIGTRVDVGDSFYAYITNPSIGTVVTNDQDNVSSRKKGESSDEIKRQVWRFVRREDGTYTIYNGIDNKVLEAEGGVDAAETNIRVADYVDGAAQRWNIYQYQDQYHIQTACGACVMDIANHSFDEGTNIKLYPLNGSGAQMYQFERLEQPEVPNLSCTPGTDQAETIFSWNATANTDYYNVYITGEGENADREMQGTSLALQLAPGKYQAYVEACNVFATTTSNIIEFEVRTEEVTTEESTTEESSTEESTTEASATTEESSTEESTTEAPTTTEESSTEESTTEAPATTEESSTEESTTEAPATTEESSTEEPTTEAPTTEAEKKEVTVNNNITTILNYIIGGNTENKNESRTETNVVNNQTETNNYTVIVAGEQEGSKDTEDDASNDKAVLSKPGIRLVGDKNQDGMLIGLYLQIILPRDGENQIITIRLI